MDVTARKRAEQTARFLADASAALAVLVDFDSTLQKVASLAVRERGGEIGHDRHGQSRGIWGGADHCHDASPPGG